MNFSRFAAVSLMFAAVLPQFSIADDNTARQVFAEAQKAFDARTSTSVDSINQAIELLSKAEGEAQDNSLKYDILILASRAQYFKGTHAQKDKEKKEIHKLGQAKADAADAITKDHAESAYYAAINLGRWGEANGVLASLKSLPELKKYVANAMARMTRDGAEGESIDGYGPLRTLGRMYKKLPAMMGGSHTISVEYLRKAVAGAPELALNIVYLADSLIKDGSKAEQAEGKEMLNKLLSNDANTYNTNRIVETNEEFALARLVLAGKEIQ